MLELNEIIFNSKGNYSDFETVLNYFKPQPPSPKIIKDSVAFMNGSYDFSTIGSNGEIVFNERIIQCSIEFNNNSKSLLMIKYSQLLEWLLSGKHELVYTGEPDMKYIAQVDDVPSFDYFFVLGGKLEFSFTAEPFKYGVNLEGSDIWDTFNFETDVVQDTEFDVVDTETVTITNVGRSVMPIINVDAAMSVVFNSKTYNLSIGDNKLYNFMLQNGDNSITINGTGHIKFIFRKQVL